MNDQNGVTPAGLPDPAQALHQAQRKLREAASGDPLRLRDVLAEVESLIRSALDSASTASPSERSQARHELEQLRRTLRRTETIQRHRENIEADWSSMLAQRLGIEPGTSYSPTGATAAEFSTLHTVRVSC